MFSFLKQKSFLGVDLGAGGVKLVELKEEKGRPVLFTYGLTTGKQDVHSLVAPVEKTAEELSGRAMGKKTDTPLTLQQNRVEEYAGILKEICKASKTIGKRSIVSLPVSAVFHALVTLPILKKEEFNSVLRAEVKKLSPRPIEEMALDFQVLSDGPNAKTQRVLVNAVPKDLVAFYSKIFQKAGLILEALEPESTALARSLVGKDNSVNLLIDIGAERTNFFIIDQGVPVTHHSIEVGGNKVNLILQNILGVGEDQVEQVKYDLSYYLTDGNREFSEEEFVNIFRSVVEPILREIEVSFDLYLRQSSNLGKRPEKIILTGGGSLLPYLSTFIGNHFKLKCYVGDPWARVVYQEGLKPMLRQIAPRMSVAIGLALRSLVK